MKYKVKEIYGFSEQTYGQYGNHRISFSVEGNDKKLSAFAKQNFTVGQEIDGEIKTTEKDGKTYYNFEFSRSPKSALETEKIVKELVRLDMGLKLILGKLEAIEGLLKGEKKVDYPTNTAPEPFPDVLNETDIPAELGENY